VPAGADGGTGACGSSGDSSIPSLQGLRADAAAAAQAASMVEALDLGETGNFSSSVPAKATKRGWARPGVENAPRVQVPWPQDFIIGQGRKSCLLYDELDIMQFVQGCISITDRTDDPAVIRAMAATTAHAQRRTVIWF
jgi:hypothetical protein